MAAILSPPQCWQLLVSFQSLQMIWGPFYLHGLTLISAWVSDTIHYKVWDEITYLFPNFNGCTVEVWEWDT